MEMSVLLPLIQLIDDNDQDIRLVVDHADDDSILDMYQDEYYGNRENVEDDADTCDTNSYDGYDSDGFQL